MEANELNRARDLARQAVQDAGQLIKSRIDDINTVDTKTNARDLVTDVDRAIEKQLRSFFSQHTPSYGWLGEESSYIQEAAPDERDPRWIVDPIDGTTNFVNGVPLCCVSIALYSNNKALLGLVHDPFRSETFEARAGEGTRLNGKPVAVQSTGDTSQALLATGFPSAEVGFTANLRLVEALMPRVAKIRALGSAALELAYVAAGRLTGFWELELSPWDTAAGVLLVREAGGTVTDTAGNDYILQNPSIVATNGRIHLNIIEFLNT